MSAVQFIAYIAHVAYVAVYLTTLSASQTTKHRMTGLMNAELDSI
jgi:hypothetical protein